jgi:hypothetical protein
MLTASPVGSHAGFSRFFIAILGRLAGRQHLKQATGHGRDLSHGCLESLFVAFRRLVEATHLAHELQGGCLNLGLAGRRLEVEEDLDVAAHRRSP